jgi:cell wall-associated NlpC family hydrolase
MNWKKPSLAILFLALLSTSNVETFAQVQQRPRIVQSTTSHPINPSTAQPSQTALSKVIPTSRPALTSRIVVADSYDEPRSLVKKTALSTPTNPAASHGYALSPIIAAFNQKLSDAMDSKVGIRYRYGATGLNSIDCSGLVWMVFQQAGINFQRSSAVNYWREFQPVSGDERFKFGTLVFFNGLGHVGIVVNEKGFYHASSSKGVTYSSFDGYWAKRIVGYRRIPMNSNADRADFGDKIQSDQKR